MIYPELKNYIMQVSSPETVDLFDSAVVIFDKYDVSSYMDLFDDTMGTYSGSGDTTIMDLLLDNLVTMIVKIINIQGVELNENVITSQLIDIADGLFELPYYDDKVALLDILSTDEPDEVKFCTLMAMVTPYDVDNLLSMLDKLNPEFIENFKSQIKTVDPTVRAVDIQKHIDAYSKFKERVIGNKSHYCDKYFMLGSNIGLPYADYIKQYQLDKIEYLHDTDSKYVSQIAEDLVGLTTLSNDGIDNPLLVIRKYLSEVYPDINVTTKVDIAVSKIVMIYTR